MRFTAVLIASALLSVTWGQTVGSARSEVQLFGPPNVITWFDSDMNNPFLAGDLVEASTSSQGSGYTQSFTDSIRLKHGEITVNQFAQTQFSNTGNPGYFFRSQFNLDNYVQDWFRLTSSSLPTGTQVPVSFFVSLEGSLNISQPGAGHFELWTDFGMTDSTFASLNLAFGTTGASGFLPVQRTNVYTILVPVGPTYFSVRHRIRPNFSAFFSNGLAAAPTISSDIKSRSWIQLPEGYDVQIETQSGYSYGATAARPVSGNIHIGEYQGDRTQIPYVIQAFSNGNLVGTYQPVLTDSQGNYSFTTPLIGNFDLVVSGPTFLKKRLESVEIQALGASGIDVTLINGDVDGNNEIGPGDFAILASRFGTELGDPNYTSAADLDGDAEIGPTDFAILSQNFGAEGD